MPLSAELDFQVMPCDGCGAPQRVVGCPCADCGHAGRQGEVNASVVRRRQGVSAVKLRLLGQGSPELSALPFYRIRGQLFTTIVECLEAILDALGPIAKSPLDTGAQTVLVRAIDSLTVLESTLRDLKRLRPYLAWYKTFNQVASELRSMTTAYLDALCASDLAAATNLAQRAQGHIDTSAALISQLEVDESRVTAFGPLQDGGDLVDKVLSSLSSSRPGLNVVQLDQAGKQTVGPLVNRGIADGHGLSYLVLELVARVFFDPERFEDVLHGCSRLFDDPSIVARIATDARSLTDLATAKTRLFDAFSVFEQTLASAKTEELVFRRLIRLYSELFEEVGVPVFSWYLLLSGQKQQPYSKLASSDSTDLARAVLSSPSIASFFMGANGAIRTAASHGRSYQVRDDEVVFELRSYGASIPMESIIDICLSFMESLCATTWVLDNELSNLGIEDHLPSDPSSVGVSIPSVVAHMLRSRGIEVISFDADEHRWEFDLRSPNHSLFTTGSAISTQLPDSVRELRLVDNQLDEGNIRMPIERTADYFARAAELNGTDRMRALIAYMDSATLDGRTPLTEDDLRFCVGVVGRLLLAQQDISMIGHLRFYAAIARRERMSAVATIANTVLADWRLPSGPRRQKLLNDLADWVRLPVPQMPERRHLTFFRTTDGQAETSG